MADIKTKNTVKDIKVFDRAAYVSTHMKNTLIKSNSVVESANSQAEHTQDTGYTSPSEYASDHISSGARTTAEQAANNSKIRVKKRLKAWINPNSI